MISMHCLVLRVRTVKIVFWTRMSSMTRFSFILKQSTPRLVAWTNAPIFVIIKQSLRNVTINLEACHFQYTQISIYFHPIKSPHKVAFNKSHHRLITHFYHQWGDLISLFVSNFSSFQFHIFLIVQNLIFSILALDSSCEGCKRLKKCHPLQKLFFKNLFSFWT